MRADRSRVEEERDGERREEESTSFRVQSSELRTREEKRRREETDEVEGGGMGWRGFKRQRGRGIALTFKDVSAGYRKCLFFMDFCANAGERNV